MKYENLISFADEEFERSVGVSRTTFVTMVEILNQSEKRKKKSGRPHTLSLENQLLLTLKYVLHHQTQLQLSAEYNLAESNANRTISKVEQALLQSQKIDFPQRHAIKNI